MAPRRITLTQRTNYPHHPTTQIEISTVTPDAFPIYLRIPAWAGPKTVLAVNGKRIAMSPEPGKFARIDRTWKNGDRIEIEFDMPTTVEAVDPQHPDLMAPVHGPLALFSVDPDSGKGQQAGASCREPGFHRINRLADGIRAGKLTLRPFASIKDEHYRLYLKVDS